MAAAAFAMLLAFISQSSGALVQSSGARRSAPKSLTRCALIMEEKPEESGYTIDWDGACDAIR